VRNYKGLLPGGKIGAARKTAGVVIETNYLM